MGKKKSNGFDKLNEKTGNCKCRFCDKVFETLNGQYTHERSCKNNPNRIDKSNIYQNLPAESKEKMKWNKGLTKETDERISLIVEKRKHTYKIKGNPFKGKKHTEETKKKIGKSVSKSRKEGYKNGTITPAKGVGRGKYSYIIYKNNKYMLRSTYEFIYALYLLENNIEFTLEKIRVPALHKNRYAETFLSDFYIKDTNTIIEIKGIRSGKDKFIKESFEAKGYDFKELFVKEIENIKEELNYIYPMDEFIENIIKGHNAKQYFIFDFDNKTDITEKYQKYGLIKKLLKILTKHIKNSSKKQNKKRNKEKDKEKYNKYKESDQIDKLGRATDSKNSKEEWQRRLDIILDTEIDLTKYGWMSKLQKLNISLSGQQIIRTLNYFNIDYYKLPNAKISKEENEEYLKSGPHYCEKCGELIEKKFGSGRFCSKACANGRKHTEEQKQKIRDSIKKYNDNKK